MMFAYADPPYLGQSKRYQEHPDAAKFDHPEAHETLIRYLESYDGWAMSASSPSLRVILPMCPEDCRVAAWIKPFASFKPNVNPAYTWEPVIFRGGRKLGRDAPTVRDYLSKEITLQKGLCGAKPPAFCEWILQLLGFDHTKDTLDDLFPGTGIMGEVIRGRACDPTTTPLFNDELLAERKTGAVTKTENVRASSQQSADESTDGNRGKNFTQELE